MLFHVDNNYCNATQQDTVRGFCLKKAQTAMTDAWAKRIYSAATISEGKRFKSVVLREVTVCCSDISSPSLNPSPLRDGPGIRFVQWLS